MSVSVAAFVKTVADSGILSFDSLEAYLRNPDIAHDSSAFAERLVQDGLLTDYQAKRIAGGESDALLIGPYVVLDLLGTGGMGCVYRAEHRAMRRSVALKVIAQHKLGNPEMVQRFEREVRAAARLDHPNIVTAFDAGDVDGTHYLAMQCVDGRTLAAIVRDEGPQPPEKVLDWVIQAARGLAYAHARGVVHRDIKPGNLMLDVDGTVKILDMGLARLDARDPDEDHLTGSGQIMGTADYMAPEQAMDTRQADARSDVYSLGATLWYLLTGRPMFCGDSAMARVVAHMQQPVPDLAQSGAKVSPAVAAAFQCMVAKQPGDRFQSMDEVLAALSNGNWRPPRRTPSGSVTASESTRARSRLAIGVGSLVVGVLVAVISLTGIGRRTRPPPASPPPPLAVAPFDAEQARAHQKAWATFLGTDIEQTNSVGMTLLLIPPGRFSTRLGKAMIDERIAAPFFLGRTEVTQAQWRAVMGTEPWREVPYTIAGDDIAVTSVSWDDVMAFCVRLTEQEQASGRIETSQQYRLPTEAEWEHACRAGTLTPFSCGADVSVLEAYAWFGNTWDEDRRPRPGGTIGDALHAHAVGVKRPNPFGLHDVHGNVWEWCADWRSDYPTDGAGLPEIPNGSPFQAYRGGSWLNDAGGCRSLTRYGGHPAYQNNCIGFRVALSCREARADSGLAHTRTRTR